MLPANVIGSLELSSLSIDFTAKWIYKMNDTIVYKCPAINFRRRVSRETSLTAKPQRFLRDPRFIYVNPIGFERKREGRRKSRKKKGLCFILVERACHFRPSWCLACTVRPRDYASLPIACVHDGGRISARGENVPDGDSKWLEIGALLLR